MIIWSKTHFLYNNNVLMNYCSIRRWISLVQRTSNITQAHANEVMAIRVYARVRPKVFTKVVILNTEY